jgi:hypothetical protein
MAMFSVGWGPVCWVRLLVGAYHAMFLSRLVTSYHLEPTLVS